MAVEGSKVLYHSILGTEGMNWTVTDFADSSGIEVTASQNLINLNGLKIVKSGLCSLDDATA